VQVKSATFRSSNGLGYVSPVRYGKGAYPPGAFDFIAAYVIPEKAWYIIPGNEVLGMRSVTLCTPTGRWEQYREAWHLLREAVGIKKETNEAEEEEPIAAGKVPGSAMERMQASMKFVRRQLDGVRD
jgi:hypothetical protein